MAQSTRTYFKNFFDEKEIPHTSWQFDGPTGMTHHIDTEYIIATILQLPNNTDEAKKIKLILMKLDLFNKPIVPFLKGLAEAVVKEDGR